MNHRRRTQVVTSDDEEETPNPQYTQKRTRLSEQDNSNENKEEQKKEAVSKLPRPVEDAKPIGEPIKSSGKGKKEKRHYESFEFNGIKYTLVNYFFSLILHNLGILRLQTRSNFNFVSEGGSCSFQTRGKGPKAICWNY